MHSSGRSRTCLLTHQGCLRGIGRTNALPAPETEARLGGEEEQGECPLDSAFDEEGCAVYRKRAKVVTACLRKRCWNGRVCRGQPFVDGYCAAGTLGATAHGHGLPIEPLEDPTEIAHLPQMLIQFTEELSKHASYRPRLCTPGSVRREGDSARHHIQFLGLECLEKCPGLVLNSSSDYRRCLVSTPSLRW